MEKRLSQQEKIEVLFTKVREYRKSKNFGDLLKFCARFKRLSPYNAWMAQLQCPSARYLLTESEWKKRFNRELRTNAKPIIILVPFGPIDMVFDISDTICANSDSLETTDEDILSELESPYSTKGSVDPYAFTHLMENLPYYGIAWEQFEAAGSCAARIEVNHEKELEIYCHKKKIKYRNDYLVSINSKAKKGEFFASLCHELGHLFCHHLPNAYGGWDVRKLPDDVEEFEAETVSWLVCKRAGVENPSEKYMAHFMKSNSYTPPISVNAILLAAGEIERMMRDSSSESLKHGILYKHSNVFKEIIKSQG